MSVADKLMSLCSRVTSLISASNEATGNGDSTLADAVQSLIEGYGAIPGINLRTGTITFSEKTVTAEITHNLGTVPKFLVVFSENTSAVPSGCVAISCLIYYGVTEQTDSNGNELTGENAIYKMTSLYCGGIAYTKFKNDSANLITEPNIVYEPDIEITLPDGAVFNKYTNTTTAFLPVIQGKPYAMGEYRWIIAG